MSENSPIKDALYAEIDKIGQNYVDRLLVEGKFSELFEKIYESSINNIDGVDEYEKHGTLAESFTHYLFTEMLIPSQRKITFANTELDMIIPNRAELKKNLNNVDRSINNEAYQIELDNIRELEMSFQDETEIWQQQLNQKKYESIQKIETMINLTIKEFAISESKCSIFK